MTTTTIKHNGKEEQVPYTLSMLHELSKLASEENPIEVLLNPDKPKFYQERVTFTGYKDEVAEASQWVGGLPEGKPEPKIIRDMRRIVHERQNEKIEGVAVDVQTAQAILVVWNNLTKEKHRELYATLPIPKMVDIAWKLVQVGG
jgi:hypothetical protein